MIAFKQITHKPTDSHQPPVSLHIQNTGARERSRYGGRALTGRPGSPAEHGAVVSAHSQCPAGPGRPGCWLAAAYYSLFKGRFARKINSRQHSLLIILKTVWRIPPEGSGKKLNIVFLSGCRCVPQPRPRDCVAPQPPDAPMLLALPRSSRVTCRPLGRERLGKRGDDHNEDTP